MISNKLLLQTYKQYKLLCNKLIYAFSLKYYRINTIFASKYK